MGVVELSSGFEDSSSAVDWSSLITSSFFSPSSFPSSSSSLSSSFFFSSSPSPLSPSPSRIGVEACMGGASLVGVASCLVASSSGGVTTKETGSLGSRGISSADSETA